VHGRASLFGLKTYQRNENISFLVLLLDYSKYPWEEKRVYHEGGFADISTLVLFHKTQFLTV